MLRTLMIRYSFFYKPVLAFVLFAFLGLGLSVRASAQTPSVPVLPNSYVLAPDDVLDIGVQGQVEFQKTVTVAPDGTINYVGVGSVMAAGQTVAQLKKTLTHDLLPQFTHPLVTISIRETHSLKISVLGAVQTEGPLNYQPGMHLLDAIARSGGLKQQPELTQITLKTDNETKTAFIDANLLMSGDSSMNQLLAPGDVVLVSPRDPELSQVEVVGQVVKSGVYPVMPGGATVVDILSLAGGATPTAAMTHVQIMHNGQERTVNLHPLLFNIADPVGATRVYAGDIVSLPLNDNKIKIVGEVRDPQIYTIPDGETWTVLTALTTAGGPTPDGDKKRVGIVRANAQGQLLLASVNTEDIIRAKPGAIDPSLLPGDILVVPKRNQPINFIGALQTGLGALLGITAINNAVR
jgi:polysaccharide export outer membrane protein